MGIRFQCPNGHPLNVKIYLAGRRGICPQCDARFLVPATSGERAVPVAEQPQTTQPPPAATHAMPTYAGPAHVGPAPEPDPAPQWYARVESGQQFGPVETGAIQQWLTEGRVSAHDWVWRTGWPDWMRAGEAFVEMLHQPPALPRDVSASDQAAPSVPTPAPAPKSVPPPAPQPAPGSEPALASQPPQLAGSQRSRQGRRKKKGAHITFWLAMAVVFLFVTLLAIVLR